MFFFSAFVSDDFDSAAPEAVDALASMGFDLPEPQIRMRPCFEEALIVRAPLNSELTDLQRAIIEENKKLAQRRRAAKSMKAALAAHFASNPLRFDL